MRTIAIRSTALVGVVSLVVLLTGCKASEEVVVDSVETSSWIKCTMGQSVVAELADGDPTQFGAGTQAQKDYFCANDDTGTLWWDWMYVGAYKYVGQSLCATAAQCSTTSNASFYSTDSATCAAGGSSQIWASGTHKSIRNGGSTVHTNYSQTPKVTTR